MAYLINGAGFSPVLAQDDADFYGGITGGATVVLPFGSQMSYTTPDANTVRLADGVLVTKEGRRVQIRAGEYEDFAIPSGTQGTTAYYIIGYRLYVNSDSEEVAEPFVQLMASASATITERCFRDGYTDIKVSLYRVRQNGVSLSTITPLFSVVKSLAYISSLESAVNTAITAERSYVNNQLNGAGRTGELTPICFGYVTNSGKNIEFMLPLKRPLSTAVTNIAVYSLSATIRQNGVYLWGSASARKTINKNELTIFDTRGGLRIRWAHNAAINAKAINNEVCVLDVSAILTLS